MLIVAISLLFGLAAFAAIAVIRLSLTAGAGRARVILAELAEIDSGITQTRSAVHRPRLAFRPSFAAA